MAIPHWIQVIAALCALLIYAATIFHYLTCGFKDADLRKIQTSPLRNSTHPHEFSVLSQGEIILHPGGRDSSMIFPQSPTVTINIRDKLDAVAQDGNPSTQKVESEDWEFKDSLGHVVFVKLSIL